MTDIVETTQTDAVTNTAPIATETPASWYANIEDNDLKGYTEKKGWKSPQDAVLSYKNLEGKLGTAVNIPNEKATPEELNAFYTKIGRPETPEAYQLPIPEGQDPAFANNMAKIMFDSGVPAKSAQALANAWNDFQLQQAQAFEAEQIKAERTQEEALKTEWGAKFETNQILAQNASKALGVTGDQIDQLQKVMGFDGVMKFFAGVASKIGEDKFISGDVGGSKATMSMTKEQAQIEYNNFMNGGLYDKWIAGDVEANKVWTNIMTTLGRV